jgi:hypothetical protein
VAELVAEFVAVALVVLVTNGLASLLVAYVAGQKGRSKVGFFWLSFFTSFLIGILVVIAIPRLEESQASQKRSYTGRVSYTASGLTVKCPLCAEWVSGEAKVCKHCGRDIADEVSSAIESERLAEDSERRAEDSERRAAIAKDEKRLTEAVQLEQEKTRKRRELFASKRFRVKALIGTGVPAIIAVTAGTIFMLTSTAERTARLENIPEAYRLAVVDCARSAGVDDAELGDRYSIKDATLALKYDFMPGVGWRRENDFVDCVVFALTGAGASDLDRGVSQDRGFLTLSRSDTGSTLTIVPTP